VSGKSENAQLPIQTGTRLNRYIAPATSVSLDMTEGNQAPAERKRHRPDFIAQAHQNPIVVRVPRQPAVNGTPTDFANYELPVTDDRGRDRLVRKGPGPEPAARSDRLDRGADGARESGARR